MDSNNPYQPPQANLGDDIERGDGALADRGARLGAAIIDGLIGGALSIPLMMLLGTWDYVTEGQSPPLHLTLLGGVGGLLIFLVLHGYFLHAYGQTVGKRLVGIRIALLDNTKPDLVTLLGKRYLPVTVISMIPVVGGIFGLIDALFIFRGDRRCVHDLIAGTQVIKA